MGWASGTYIMQDLIEVIKNEIKDFETRKRIYIKMIESLESMDWDTEDGCLGYDDAFDKALKTLHPECFDDGD